MKLSENDAFIRKMRKLLENNSIYNVGLNIKLLELIEEYQEEPCKCHGETKSVFLDKESFDKKRKEEENDISSDFVCG